MSIGSRLRISSLASQTIVKPLIKNKSFKQMASEEKNVAKYAQTKTMKKDFYMKLKSKKAHTTQTDKNDDDGKCCR